eukprot:1166151-Pleurochrysis_carterae.AAC.1
MSAEIVHLGSCCVAPVMLFVALHRLRPCRVLLVVRFQPHGKADVCVAHVVEAVVLGGLARPPLRRVVRQHLAPGLAIFCFADIGVVRARWMSAKVFAENWR